MAFLGFNAFEGVQNIEALRASEEQRRALAAEIALREQQRQAREALGMQFGAGAADPQGFASIGQAQAQQGFADVNARRATLAETDQARQFSIDDETRARQAIGNGIGVLQQALSRGASPEQLQEIGGMLQQSLGASPEDVNFALTSLRQGVSPEAIQEAFLGQVRGQQTPQARPGAFGAPQTVEVTDEDGNVVAALAVPVQDAEGNVSLQVQRDAAGRPISPARFNLGLAGTDTRIRRDAEGGLVGEVIEGTRSRSQQENTEQITGDRQRVARLEEIGRRNAAQVTQLTAAGLEERANRALGLLDRVPGAQQETVLNAIFRGVGTIAPGSTEFELARELETIGNNVALQALSNLDATLTPVSDRDFQALQRALGDLRAATSPQTVRTSLRDVLRLARVLDEQARRVLGEDSPEEEESIDALLDRFAPVDNN